MAPRPPISRISLEDVAGIEGIDKLLPPLNAFMTSTCGALDKGITFSENHQAQIKVLDVVVPSPWVTVAPFSNSWVNYGTPFFNAAYRKWDDGTVELRGTVKGNDATFTTTLGDIFTLPAGYRPESDIIITTTSVDAFAQARISALGVVKATVALNTGVKWFSLDGIRFLASDASPGPNLSSTLSFKSELKSKCLGLIPIAAASKTTPGTLVQLPRVAWEDSGTGQIKISNLLGVSPGSYSFTFLAIAG